MRAITIDLDSKERGSQLTGISDGSECNVKLVLVARREFNTTCPWCGHSRQGTLTQYNKDKHWICVRCKQIFSPGKRAKQHVRVSFTGKDDAVAMVMNENHSVAFVAVPDVSYLYLFNRLESEEEIHVEWE